VIPKLLGVLIGMTLAFLVLSLVGQTAGQSLFSQLFTGPRSGGPDQPGPTNERFTAQVPAVTEKSVVADRLTPRQRESSDPSEVTGTVSREASITSRKTSPPPQETSTLPPGARTPANETGAPPKAGPGQGASGGPRLSATARPRPSTQAPSNQAATGPSPVAMTPKATYAELVGQPVSRGWGDSYAVRLFDSAGRPLVVAEVLLVAHMADGAVEYITMGALPERGTYRGTVPTGRSTRIDLRVRVSAGDNKLVEVPVRP
jgi:hypothetical protein